MTPSWFDASMLPEDWRLLPLRRLGRVLNGGTPTSDPVNWDGPFPFVTPPDLNGADGALVATTGRTLTKVGTRGAGLAPGGSVLVSTRAPIGHVGRIGEISAFNQGCRAVAPQAGVEPRYMALALVAARADLMARGQGTTFIELSSPAFASIPIPVPPPDEQRAIVDYLDQETVQIDALVAKQEEFIGLLRERRRMVVPSVLTKAAPVGHRPDKLHRRTRMGNGSTPRSGEDRYWLDGDIPWVNSSVVNRTQVLEPSKLVTRVAVKECHLPMVKPGSILVALTGEGKTRGAATILRIGSTINQHLAFIEPDERFWVPDYLLWLLRSQYDHLRRISSENGATKGGLTVGDLRALRVPMPELQQQHQLVKELEEVTARIDALIDKAEEHIALAKERRSALITAAVTGQVDVRTASRKAG
ncbi:restriction endonuclease subunit S [Janibacter hoylei PVAS-1]|uniref:Restriction endonuclease subunit S n=2 Tax=Janibacter hoylei PVAS-1 TaxID=1210046 RepID=A0A444BBM9_9MICO|nr:restriction endonuclease subunit S [Janibacter hoylei]RWU85760.1 restriction endonuclease subunit S [Janibacter hoylei PVAS-1]